MVMYHRLPRNIWLLIRRACDYSKFSCLIIIHAVLWVLWLLTYGFWVWRKAYPITQTQFVLFIHSISIWAIVMLSTIKARRLSERRPREEIHPEGHISPGDKDTNYRLPPNGLNNKHQANTAFYWLIIVVYAILVTTYENSGDHRYRPIVEEANRSRNPSGYETGEKVFIAALFHNNENILPRWSREMLQVARYIGTDNVFFSIVESYSDDSTPALLKKFEQKLTTNGIRHRFIIQDTSIPPLIPGSMETRINYLSAVRNLAIAPLREGAEGYDRVIFSNDIMVEAESVLELLNTRDGDYDMVCGIDTGRWGLYDAWVTRDRFGQLVSSLWPYILEEGGRRAVWWDEPVPVFTCWGGIIAFRADPLLPTHLRNSGRLSTLALPEPLPKSHPAYLAGNLTSPALTPPISFRASGPDECLSSESFLLPYDFRRQFLLDKIFMNPRVIVSYGWRHYFWYKYVTRHWLVMWWMKNVDWRDKERMETARVSIGSVENAYDWDGGKCMKVGIALTTMGMNWTHPSLLQWW